MNNIDMLAWYMYCLDGGEANSWNEISNRKQDIYRKKVHANFKYSRTV